MNYDVYTFEYIYVINKIAHFSFIRTFKTIELSDLFCIDLDLTFFMHSSFGVGPESKTASAQCASESER